MPRKPGNVGGGGFRRWLSSARGKGNKPNGPTNPSGPGSSGYSGRASLAEGLKKAGVRDISSGRIGPSEVSVTISDMTQLPVNALVVPHFKGGVSFGGVGGAVYRSGGETGLRALEKVYEQRGELPFSETIVTESGTKRWPFLLNVVSVASEKDQEFGVVFKSIYNALKEAANRGIESVAIPALGTGIIGQLTADQSARAIFGAIEFLGVKGFKVPDVAIAIYGDQAAFKAFSKVLEKGTYAIDQMKPGKEVGQREFDHQKWEAEMNRDIDENRGHDIQKN